MEIPRGVVEKGFLPHLPICSQLAKAQRREWVGGAVVLQVPGGTCRDSVIGSPPSEDRTRASGWNGACVSDTHTGMVVASAGVLGAQLP